jgi:hypothetical protein
MIKSTKMNWEGHVAYMAEKRSAYRFLVGKPERKKHSGRYICMDRRAIFK